MPVKVSVVVPVYNPGEYIDPLIESLLAQSMPREDYEIVFVDDGSTDETPDKLDRLAEQHDNVTALHIPNSGWPGRPRNVGIDNSTGEYIQFVDHDDELAPTALERLYAYAVENDSDVVVGKEVRRTAGWGVVGPTFDTNRPRANVRTAPLLGIMTPHKMFRRALLDRYAIRFHEGPRRMEDHPFVLEAYLRSDVISVLADQPVYYWNRRPDKGNAGAREYDWAEFYVFMRDTLDVIERLAQPEEFRNRLLAFYFDSKGLGMLSRSVRHRPPEAVRKHFDDLRDLAAERFPPEVDAHLKGVVRARAQLLRAGDFDGLVALANLEAELRPRVELLDLDMDADARLRVRVRAGFHDDQGPLMLESVEGKLLWRPRVEFEGVSEDCFDLTGIHRNRRVELALRHRGTAEVFLVPGVSEATTPEEGRTITVEEVVTFAVDPEEAAFGRALEPGLYDVFVRIRMPPWRRQTRLPSPSSNGRVEPLGTAAWNGRAVIPFSTRADNVALDVGQTRFSVLAATMGSPPAVRLDRAGSSARLVLALPGLRLRDTRLAGRLRLESVGGKDVVRVPLRVVEDEQGQAAARAAFEITALGGAALRPGRWRVAARLDGRRVDLGMVLTVTRRRGLTLTSADGAVLAAVAPTAWWRVGRDQARSTMARTLRSLRGRSRRTA